MFDRACRALAAFALDEALFFAVAWGAAGVAVLHWSLRP